MTSQEILEEIKLKQPKLPNRIDQSWGIIISNDPERYFTSARQQLKSECNTEVYYPINTV